MSILFICNFLGLMAFMFSGALIAIKNKMDLGGVIFLSAITGLGGGTIRDILLQLPVFWMKNNWSIYLALIISVMTFFFYPVLKNYIQHHVFEKILNVFDIIGLTTFMISTVSLAQQLNQSFLTSIVLSIITCVGGGVIRDIICGKQPSVFESELNATSVALGSAIYIVLTPISPYEATIFSCLFLVIVRAATKHFNLNLPKKLLE